jgi:hypothetical protein
MNWRIAVSLLWLIFPTYLLINEIRSMSDTAQKLEDLRSPHPEDLPPPPWETREIPELEHLLRQQQDAVALIVILAIGAPIALLVLGLAATWIIAGFRQPTK